MVAFSAARIELHRLSLPLRTPYKLAMGAVSTFDTILIEAIDSDGRHGWGEATILTGYTDETIEGAWAEAQRLAHLLCISTASETSLDEAFAEAPFTVSAFRSALEFLANPSRLADTCARRVPLLAGLNATDPSGIEREMEAALAAGFATLKVKVGFDADADLERIRLIQSINRGRMRLRVDGNQGFTAQAACRFAADLDPDSIELLEQPCAAADWEAAAAVAAISTVPMMLDESIYGAADVRRAARDGSARFIKLKLMKMGGIAALEAGLDLVRETGMEPVLGNGVATEIGCWAEAAVASTRIRNAGEMNGFLRPATTLLCEPLRIEGGCIVLPPGPMPAPDPDRLSAHRIAHVVAKTSARVSRRAVAALGASLLPWPALAQDWAPSRPIRMVVPYAPGGGADTTARLLARPMSEALGRPVVVENRAGAAGTIGAAEVARAAPDGHTILLDAAAHTANPSLLRNLPFDYGTAFAPVSQITVLPMLLLRRGGRAPVSLNAFLAEARTARTPLNYGSAGNGSATHLASAALARAGGFPVLHVVYRGGAPMMQDLMAGNIDFAFAVASISLPMVREGTLQALAVSSTTRLSSLPTLPTVAEEGLQGFDMAEWNGLYLPAGTPQGIVARFHRGTLAALADPTLRERLPALGAEAVGSDPPTFTAFLRQDRERLALLIREAGITIE
jgi:tripartite-type tricarboxylate transporter receptor subunit TctC/L-alanine-DL-glutamate epimerase-like enolase superfamily enzyme